MSLVEKNKIYEALKKLNEWEFKKNAISRLFKFSTYMDGINYVHSLALLAEEQNHHPDISFGWGYCKVKIFTHAINGLAESDFILAAKIDKIN